jgi:head-tail adaptor
MGISKLFLDTVYIKRATETRGTDGAVLKTWATSSTVKGFVNETAGLKEYRNGQVTVISNARAFFPLGTDVQEKDRLQVVENSKYYDVLYVNIPITSLKGKKKFITADLVYFSEVNS